jgi:hypothetical protein
MAVETEAVRHRRQEKGAGKIQLLLPVPELS